jgi:hypothetical protein
LDNKNFAVNRLQSEAPHKEITHKLKNREMIFLPELTQIKSTPRPAINPMKNSRLGGNLFLFITLSRL